VLTGSEQKSLSLWDEGNADGASDVSFLWKPSVTSLHTEVIRFLHRGNKICIPKETVQYV